MATALLEKQVVGKTEAARNGAEPVQYHWTVDALYRALDAGAFEDPKRLELVHGRIIARMPQGPRHTSLRLRIARRMRGRIEPTFFVQEEALLRLALDGEPVADLILTHREDYGDRHPTQDDVVLVIEVAASSADFDTGEKADLYAQAGINDYWVVLVNEAALVRHRLPTPDGYAEVVQLAGGDAISPLAAPAAVWTVDALLGREEEK